MAVEAPGWNHREALRLTMPQIDAEGLTGALVQAVDGALDETMRDLTRGLCERAGAAGDHSRIATACQAFRRQLGEQAAPKHRKFEQLLTKYVLRVPDAVLGGPLAVRPADLIAPLRTLEEAEACNGDAFMGDACSRNGDAGACSSSSAATAAARDREEFERSSAELLAAAQRGQELQREFRSLTECLKVARALRASIEGEGELDAASVGAGLMNAEGKPMSRKQQMMLDLQNLRALAGAEATAGGA